jgi:cobalamin biosynthesis protein CobT
MNTKIVDNLLLEFDEFIIEVESSDEPDNIFIKPLEEADEEQSNEDAADQESKGGEEDSSEGDQESDQFGSDEDFDDSGFGDEEDLSLEDLGKVYQLNMIYKTLLDINDYTYDMLLYDPKLKKVLALVKKLIDYYKLIVYNLNKYMDKIDDIIKMYRHISKSILQFLEIKSRKIMINKIEEDNNHESN